MEWDQISDSSSVNQTFSASYTFSTKTADPEMFILYGRPWTFASTITTPYFVTYAIPYVFNGTLQDVAIAFDDVGGGTSGFGGPIISTVVSAESTYDDTDNTTLYTFHIQQTSSQEAIYSLSDTFGGNLNEDLGTLSKKRRRKKIEKRKFRQCTMVVGDKVPSPDNNNLPGGFDLSGARSSLQAPIINPEDAGAILNEAADIIANALDLVDLGGNVGNNNNNDLSNWAKFVKVYGFNRGKPVEPKDWLTGIGTAIKGVASLIQECTKGNCDPKKALDAIGGTLASVSSVVGAALPVVGTVLVAIGSIIQVIAMFLPAAKVSNLPSLTSYDIQNVVESAISKYNVAMTASELDAISTITQIDIDNTNSFINELGYIKAHPEATGGRNVQMFIDEQIDR